MRHGVPRIVYASSNHAVGRTPRDRTGLGADVPARPDTFYGVAKVAAEALLHLYVDRHGIDAISTRIGSFLATPDDTSAAVHLALPRRRRADVRRRADRAEPRLRRRLRDLGQHPRLVGPRPRSRAGLRARRTTPRRSPRRSRPSRRPSTDRAEAAHVGGPFATGEFDRPAFD